MENNITVSMAIVDFIPVILFCLAILVLERDFYNKMVKGAYALFVSGSVMVFMGGFYKALWKILYALEICDWEALNSSFFPMSAVGFLFVFLSMFGLTSKYKANKANKATALAVAPFTSSMPFVVDQVIGCAGFQFALMNIARKMKKHSALILFIVAFIFMLGMGYLSSQFDDSSSMHWTAQVTNIISNGALLAGVVILHKNGLKVY